MIMYVCVYIYRRTYSCTRNDAWETFLTYTHMYVHMYNIYIYIYMYYTDLYIYPAIDLGNYFTSEMMIPGQESQVGL